MKQIFTARNDMELHFVKGLLEQEGIETVVQGEALEGAWADLPLSQTALPGIWIKEEDVERATPIVEEYRQREKKYMEIDDGSDEKEEPVGSTWTCPKCHEQVEDQFDVCWNCGTERPQERAE